MERTNENVDEFLGGLAGPRGEDIRRLDDLISERMQGAERRLYRGTFWGGSEQAIIGYGDLDYQNRSGGQVEWFVVGLAEQKDHISVYVNAAVDGRYLLRDYQDRLGKVKAGSASVAFGSIEDLDLDVFVELVESAAQDRG